MDILSHGGAGEMLLGFLVFFIPVFLVLFSKFIPSHQKPFWVLFSFIFSWLGYVFIYAFVLKKCKE